MNKKIKKSFLIIFVISILLSTGFVLFKNRNSIKKSIYINSVLSKEAYSYLPEEAKDYVKEIYEKTGKVILTEKNKQENKLYLNPQYVEYLTYSEEDKDKLGEIPISMIIDYSTREVAKSINVPSSYDLRNDNGKNYVTPIRDQGNLGICWTFATAGAVESHILKENNSSYTSSSRLISERQIDYATSRNGIRDYKSEYMSFIDRSLGDGGNFYISTIALANGISLVDYNNFKAYDDNDLSKMELSDVLSYNKSLYEVNSTIIFPSSSLRDSTSVLTEEEAETRENYLKEIKQNIMENGAAYVGTYMDSSCRYVDSNLNNTVIDVYNCSVTGGHAMEIIGWNDNIEYKYCADTKSHKSKISNCNRVISGKGVWILKNSWGDTLQYPYLTYDSLYTSIGFIDELQSKQSKDWDNNYILGDEYDDVKYKEYTLSNTKIKNDEKIKRVKFIAEYPDAEYSVRIKKKDGTYRTFSKTSNLPGLMTIDITEDILVNKNTEITLYSLGGFIDKFIVFTSNVDLTSSVDLSKYNNTMLSDDSMRLYSETKNIPSGATITYKMYNSSNQDVSNKVSFTNNIVAENNINTLATFSRDLDGDTYHINAIYNSNVVGSMNIDITKMDGLGTKNNPYIITNSTQLYQIRRDLDAYYELGNDIDLTEDTREGGRYSNESNVCPQGYGWEAINNFSGSLDGKGYTIKGLYQNNYITCNEEKQTWYSWNDNGNGLFGTMKGNATVKNLVLENFDMNCQGGYCGALVSKYIGNMNDSGNANDSDETEYTATFENIAIKNSKINGVYNNNNNDSSLKNSYGGGLFGYLESGFGNINISNIYLDINLTLDNINNTGYLASTIQGNNVNIKNIRVLGDIQGKYTDGSANAILIHSIYGSDPKNIKNIVSTVTATKVMGSLLGNVNNNNLVVNGINILNVEDKPLCKNNGCSNATNVNIYNKDTQLIELTKSANYNSWAEFSTNWDIKTIGGIPRIPTLKFMNFEYTNIPNITLNQVLNKKVSIFDYLTPKIDAAKRISYRSNNEAIVKLSSDGTIIPQATGNTTIHVESLYDGYIKDVPIQVVYAPHYTINFDPNGGTGEMESIEVENGNDFILPENKFEKEYYVFNNWNTKADGSGISYTDLGRVNAMNDKESITLYAQWIGEERTVTFDANGGTVSPESKIVRYGGKYGELPIPTRSGYGFTGWGVKQGGIYHSVDFDSNIYGYTLVAGWSENSYTIVYDANGGKIKSNNITDFEFMSDSIATAFGENNHSEFIASEIFEREGYTFREWNTKPDGSGTSYYPDQTINRSSNLTLYAIWRGEHGIVTYNSNYGNNQTRTQTFNYDENTKLDKNIFTRSGYTFKEWNTKADGSGTVYSDEQIINKSEDLVLFAIWVEDYTYVINNYDTDEYNKYINKIIINTDVDSFTNNISLNSGYGVEVDTKIINDRRLLYTGGKTRILKGLSLYREYTNVVVGDINGDALINSADLLKVRQHLLGINILSGAYFLSSDINYDNTINSADLLRVRQHLLGTKPIS